MSDPLLDAHRLAPGLFSLGFPLSPISIRDQLIRGTQLGKRLQPAAHGGRDVLVVGAGVGGVCAAVILAIRGFRVDLVENATMPFSVQATANTRYLDPWQYDWPVMTKAPSVWPSPLSYAANNGRALHRRWSRELAHWVSLLGALSVHYSTQITALASLSHGGRSRLRASLKPLGTRHFDFVILAAGFGSEKSSLPASSAAKLPPPAPGVVPTVSTPRFWDRDTFEDRVFGLMAPPGSVRSVAIVGGGDGALQDFLRAATGPFGGGRAGTTATAREIFDRAFPTPSPIRSEVLERAASIDAQFQRAWSWSESRSTAETVAFSERHAALGALAKFAYGNAGATVDGLWRTDLGDISVICPTAFFTATYTFNCFLVLLLACSASALGRRGVAGGHCLMLDTTVDDVFPAGSYPVPVNFSHSGPYTLSVHPTGAKATTTVSADFLIVRTGITPSPFVKRLLARVSPSRPRHLLPIH